jgi:hypothetical protein
MDVLLALPAYTLTACWLHTKLYIVKQNSGGMVKDPTLLTNTPSRLVQIPVDV